MVPAPARVFMHTLLRAFRSTSHTVSGLGFQSHSSHGFGFGFSGAQPTRFRVRVFRRTAHTVSVSGFQAHTPRMERRLETDRGDYSDMISTKVRPRDPLRLVLYSRYRSKKVLEP